MKKIIWMFLLTFAISAQAAFRDEPTTVFADWLYWQVREGGADNWGQHFSPGARNKSYDVLDAPFQWNSGVRLGVSHEFDQNSFDITLAYTHYQTIATNQSSGQIYSSFDANYFANNTNGASFGPFYQHGKIRWQFYYDTLDLDLGHTFKIDNILTARPYLGLKGAVINQNINSTWRDPVVPTNFTVATENLKNNFWGLGPMIGVDTTWPIYSRNQQSFSLIGNLAGGLLWGNWTFQDVYNNNTPLTINVNTQSVNGASPLLDALLALQWNNRFSKSDLSIRLGYEAQMWFNQMQFYSLNMGRVNRSMNVQGCDLEFRYNFF